MNFAERYRYVVSFSVQVSRVYYSEEPVEQRVEIEVTAASPEAAAHEVGNQIEAYSRHVEASQY